MLRRDLHLLKCDFLPHLLTDTWQSHGHLWSTVEGTASLTQLRQLSKERKLNPK